MSWKITYEYETGNTFGCENTSGEFDYEFDTLELAQNALARMGEHYKWRFSIDAWHQEDRPTPTWWKPQKKPTKSKGTFTEYYNNMHFNVVGNDGKEIWLYAGTYMGYFETLQAAQVETTEPGTDKNKLCFR